MSLRLKTAAMASVALLCLGSAVHAQAEVSTTAIHVEPSPHNVTIRIDNLQVEHNSLSTRGDRIYIDIPERSAGQELRLADDKTVKMVEIREGSKSRISIKLRHGRDKTKQIGMAATIENIGGGVVLHVPRWPIQVEAKAAAAIEAPVVVAAKPQVAPPVEASSAQPAAEVSPETATEAAALTASSEPANQPEAAETAAITGNNGSEGGGSLGLIAGILLLLCGGAVFAWRAKKAPKTASAELEEFRVVATKQLGGKSKVVWLSAGERDMIVAVCDSGTQLLSEWNRRTPALPAANVKIAPTLMDMGQPAAIATPQTKKSDGVRTVYDFQASLNAATEAGRQDEVVRIPAVVPKSIATPAHSPAVAGLIKMREQAPEINRDVATHDEEADAEWARELLKATRETMFRSVG